MSAPPALTVAGLTKRFGRVTALEGLDLTVPRGVTVVLWGPNGAGKTTLLRCLLGVMPCEGVLSVLGHDVRTEGKTVRQLIGYVPQEVRLPGEQTVDEALGFYARLRQVPQPQARRLLDDWGLHEAAARPVRALSGGMKQRLALAIALLSDPPILFLDEPSSHLDLAARRELLTLLEQLKPRGKTVLLCSHRTNEIWKIADQVVVLKQGRKVAEGPPEAIAEQLGEHAVLWLVVPREHKEAAAAELTRQGFPVERNGVYLWVRTALGRKSEPLRVLVAAGIPVADFDTEPGS